jgi:hypothetical protein
MAAVVSPSPWLATSDGACAKSSYHGCSVLFLKIAALVGAATDDPFNHDFQIMERLIWKKKVMQ